MRRYPCNRIIVDAPFCVYLLLYSKRGVKSMSSYQQRHARPMTTPCRRENVAPASYPDRRRGGSVQDVRVTMRRSIRKPCALSTRKGDELSISPLVSREHALAGLFGPLPLAKQRGLPNIATYRNLARCVVEKNARARQYTCKNCNYVKSPWSQTHFWSCEDVRHDIPKARALGSIEPR
jgi:hypothetical protein